MDVISISAVTYCTPCCARYYCKLAPTGRAGCNPAGGWQVTKPAWRPAGAATQLTVSALQCGVTGWLRSHAPHPNTLAPPPIICFHTAALPPCHHFSCNTTWVQWRLSWLAGNPQLLAVPAVPPVAAAGESGRAAPGGPDGVTAPPRLHC